jgi:hypothetical protein
MLGERIESRPTLRLVSVTSGTWLRPDVRTPEAAPATLPAPYWASASRRAGLRRSPTRVTLRETFPRRAHRSEAYLLAITYACAADAEPRAFADGPGAEALPAPSIGRERAPIFRLVADMMAQVFRPTSEAV